MSNFLAPSHSKTEDGLTVTNKYVIPTDDVTATKVWEDGPEPRPTVWFKLYRQVGATGTPEAVPGAAIQELADGTLSVTWNNVEKTDIGGNPYIFTVKEVDADGNDFEPANYSRVVLNH